MNLVDEYFESIKPSLSEEEILMFDKFITILNEVDTNIMDNETKLNYLNKFASYSGEAWEIESKRNYDIITLSSFVSNNNLEGKKNV